MNLNAFASHGAQLRKVLVKIAVCLSVAVATTAGAAEGFVDDAMREMGFKAAQKNALESGRLEGVILAGATGLLERDADPVGEVAGRRGVVVAKPTTTTPTRSRSVWGPAICLSSFA